MRYSPSSRELPTTMRRASSPSCQSFSSDTTWKTIQCDVIASGSAKYGRGTYSYAQRHRSLDLHPAVRRHQPLGTSASAGQGPVGVGRAVLHSRQRSLPVVRSKRRRRGSVRRVRDACRLLLVSYTCCWLLGVVEGREAITRDRDLPLTRAAALFEICSGDRASPFATSVIKVGIAHDPAGGGQRPPPGWIPVMSSQVVRAAPRGEGAPRDGWVHQTRSFHAHAPDER